MDKTKLAVEVFNSCAKEYQDKFMYLDLYNDTFDLFCDSIKKQNADILEVACGPGNITKYLLKSRADFKILGIDLAPNMITLAANNNPAAEFKIMDCRDVSRMDKKFDGIMCGFCLPYLSKEEAIQFIKDASTLLQEGGVVYISTMEGDYNTSGLKKSSSGKNECYIHYHQADYLIGCLKENYFSILDLQRKNYPAQDGTTTVDLIIIARK